MNRIIVLCLLTLTMLISACAPTAETPLLETPAEATEPTQLTLMSHDSFAMTEEVLAQFEKTHNITLEILRVGDAGAALNQAILSKENPLADVFFGVDNTFLTRALENEIFESYASPQLENIPMALQLDEEHRLLPVDYGDVCLNYDKGWFTEADVAPPAMLEDLLTAPYQGLTVVQNPATSSPGLAFLLATVAHFGEGEEGYLNFWQQMVEQDVLVVDGWSDAYYSEFTRYEGTRPIVVSYASSPPAEVYFAEEELAEAPTAAVLGDEACFRQIEFVGILAGTQNRAAAEQLIDFMLDLPFQEEIPLNMFVFPANEHAELPPVFQEHAQLAENPATMTPAEIDAGREEWISAWTETVLR